MHAAPFSLLVLEYLEGGDSQGLSEKQLNLNSI